MATAINLTTTPAMAPPAGEHFSGFNSAMTTVQKKFITVYIATLTVATITLLLRIWCRLQVVRAFWADDFAVVGAWLMDIGFFVCCLKWITFGFGYHLWDVSLYQVEKYAGWATPIVTTYCWAPMLTKFSILLLYIRINPEKWFRRACYVLMFMILGYTIATTLIVAAGCKPSDPKNTQCINDLALAQAILNIASDVFVIILPIPMIHKLRIPFSQKLALGAILAAGSFVVVASIIRLVIIERLPGLVDTTWVEAETCVWSAIEINVGLICNCLIVLKPFVRHYFGKFLTSFGSTRERSKTTQPLSSGGWGGSRGAKNAYVLGSIDRSRNVAVGTNTDDAKVVVASSDEILVSSTFTVEAGPRHSTTRGPHTSTKMKDVDAESQESMVKRVKRFDFSTQG